jgi:hypothetical protein
MQRLAVSKTKVFESDVMHTARRFLQLIVLRSSLALVIRV